MGFSGQTFIDLLQLNFNGARISTPEQESQLPYQQASEIAAELDSRVRILDHAALVSISDLKGRITFANENFCRTSGYSLDELLGQPHNIIRHPDMPASTFREMWRTIGSGNVWQGEIKNRARNGSTYWVQATIAPVLGPDGKPKHYISVRFDITAQKRVEEELREAKKKIDLELHENVTCASRIHSAIMPSERDLSQLFPHHFLIYRPLRIVSGDFYWTNQKENKRFLAFGDSTGHGVSAAFISLVAVNTLARIIEKTNCRNPSAVLHRLDESMVHFINSNPQVHVPESADMTFFCIDDDTLELHYASAHTIMYIIRKGELIELNYDYHSVGGQHNGEFKVKDHYFKMHPGDRLFVMSDGMYDQLGGIHGKRFGKKQMKQLLIETSTLSMSSQKEVIELVLSEWQGLNEQTDDMSLIAIEV